jgi:two-component system osmolarity sensor histidine kinase EnvZ
MDRIIMPAIKRMLPRSLFGRALLILILPMILLQLVTAFIFFDRHWDNVTRHMSGTLSGEIAFLVHELHATPKERRSDVLSTFTRNTGIVAHLHATGEIEKDRNTSLFPEFRVQMRKRMTYPYDLQLTNDGETILVRVSLPEGILTLEVTVKRLESATTHIFLMWMVSAAALFLFIAIIFLRNQMRPISRLAAAAESFGRGREIVGFRPQGATEVRRASRAFIIMRERIKRQLRTRTEMLAGISHDLRTPLTRMKLQLAMLGDSQEIHDLNTDVEQMEHMIEEYLDFARGVGREQPTRVAINEVLLEVVESYQRMGRDVTLGEIPAIDVDLRGGEFRRVMHNLIDNALRYGRRCRVGARLASSYIELHIDDDGPGIPLDQRETVFRPFTRLDPSRNIDTGGVGLGLAITRDIVRGHGGEITLDSAPSRGLRVILQFPL